MTLARRRWTEQRLIHTVVQREAVLVGGNDQRGRLQPLPGPHPHEEPGWPTVGDIEPGRALERVPGNLMAQSVQRLVATTTSSSP